MNPINRKEKYYQAILDGKSSGLPTPITREETYLKAIAENGGGGGESTGIWKPSVSNEGVISWEKSTSEVTPEEQNIKGPTGATGATGPTGPTGPAGPGLASGGVVGSMLFKSSNDDYATEWVDSSIATVEGNPATAETDGAGISVHTVVDIEPIQAGSGDPSPENVRAISGYDSIEIGVNGSITTIPLPETVYGGTLDVESGTLTVDRGMIYFGNLNYGYAGGYFYSSGIGYLIKKPSDNSEPANVICSSYETKAATERTNGSICVDTNGTVVFTDSRYTDVTAFKTAVIGQKLVYELATPHTISLPPHQIKLMQGVNNISTNAHSVTLTYRKGQVVMNSDLEGLADSVNKVVNIIVHPDTYLRLVDLGDEYTDELKHDIRTGAFRKACVGGVLTINSHEYIMAHPEYWYNAGNPACTTHHMVVVPAMALVSGKMNSTNTTAGGYLGADFKTGNNSNTALADITAIIEADFGAANILTHREIFTNAVDENGASSGRAWTDSGVDLMSETMVYGHCVCSKPGTYGHYYEVGIDKTQLELFAKRPDLITINGGWWLRSVVSSTEFAVATDVGGAAYNYASTSYKIRPAFAIC